MTKDRTIQVLVDAAHGERIEAAAKLKGLSLSSTVRLALLEAFPAPVAKPRAKKVAARVRK